MTWTLELGYAKPPDGLSANWRGHWATKARSTASVRALVKHLAIKAGIEPMQRCQVEVIWCVADRRRRDADNASADKGVTAGIVPDDDPSHMVKLMPRIEYRQGCTPHFEVLITDLGFRPDSVDQVAQNL